MRQLSISSKAFRPKLSLLTFRSMFGHNSTMHEKIAEKISVITLFDRENSQVMPVKIRWQGRYYYPQKLGLHHTVREGRVLHHIFSVADQTTCFKLDLNTETLHWTLDEISDGL